MSKAATIDLAAIAKKAHVHPRIARSRLRRAGSKAPRTVGTTRWLFPMSSVPAVKAIIKD